MLTSATESLIGGVACDEAALVQEAQQTPAYFAALYDHYVERIYWYMHTHAAGDDAQDLTQQVFLQALAALPRYRPRKGPFVAWLFGIARHVAADYHRAARRTLPWERVRAEDQPGTGQDLEAGVVRQEDLERLRALLTRLDPQKRDLLALRFAGRLTAAEIAVVIGKSEAATKKALARTLQTVKEHYHGHAH